MKVFMGASDFQNLIEKQENNEETKSLHNR